MNSPYTFCLSTILDSHMVLLLSIYITNIPVYIGLYMFHMFMHTVANSVRMPLASRAPQMFKTF